MRSIIFTLSILVLATLTTAFPNGSGTCNSNQTVIEGVPNKPMGVLAELGFSFAVTMEGNEYVPGGPPVKFCVHGKDTFKGLLLYAVDMKPERNHVGSWIIPNGAPYKILQLNCTGDPDGTVTHSDPTEKGPNVCMEWKPPTYDAGPLTFVGTIVKNKAAGFQIVRLPTIFNPKGGNNKYTTTNCDYETTKTDKYEPTKTNKYEKTTPPYKEETTPSYKEEPTLPYKEEPTPPYKEKPTTTPYKYETEPTYENTATDPNQFYEPSGFNPPTFNAADGITYSGLLLLLQLIVVSTLILYHH